MPTARVGDVDLYYEVHGSGAPLLLIPGLGGDVGQFRPLIDELAASFRVLAFDPRGAGRSARPDVPYSIEMMANDAARLMDAVEVPRAHVFGFSLGGRVALAHALMHPERVESLVLAGTAARSVDDRRTRLRHAVAARVPRLRLLQRFDPRPVGGYLRQERAWRDFDCSARLGEIRVRALILHARDDLVVPYERAVELHAALENSRLVPFAGGHLFVLTAATPSVSSDVRDFVASL